MRLLNLSVGAYVNSGFMLLNLEAWRKEGIAEKCLSELRADPESFPTQDESAINRFCMERIFYLPEIYNFYATQFAYPEQTCTPEDIRVLHFILGKKPWMRENTFSPIWYAEAAMISSVTGLLETPVQSGSLRVWLRRVNQARKVWQARLSLGAGRRRYLHQYKPYRTWAEKYAATYTNE